MAAAADPSSISSAISDGTWAAERVQSIETLLTKYSGLDSVLAELPSRGAGAELMVPVGELAFMPGRVMRADRVLVYIGEELYMWKTPDEARAVVTRRRQCE